VLLDHLIGIQIHEPVAGVAIGLVSKCADDGSITDYRILTDILVNNFHQDLPVQSIFFLLIRVLKIIWVIRISK
jgi:uncharacterized membrane protein